MTDHFKERSTRDYHQKQLFSKEDLERRESLCTHEDPPFCNAACPLKLDVKAMLAAVSDGDFAKGRSLLEFISPFPEILAWGCDAPCRKVCRRSEIEESVNIPAVERAIMQHSPVPKAKGLLKLRKKQRLAVFGSSLFTRSLLACPSAVLLETKKMQSVPGRRLKINSKHYLISLIHLTSITDVS